MVVGNNFTLTAPTAYFIWREGHFTTLSPTLPAGLVAIPGINRYGVMAASVTTVSSSLVFQSAGFTLHGPTVADVTLPGTFSVSPTGINDAGLIVGSYQTSTGGATLGFVKSGAKVTTLDGGTGFTVPMAIDAAGGSVVGYTYSSPFTSGGTAPLYAGFLYRDHTFTTIAVPGADFTLASGISRPDVVFGTYQAGSSPGTGSLHGFVYRRGAYSNFDVRGATSTMLEGANASGQLTGCYTDAKGTHGFVFTP
jgi:hypothetical protein